MRGFEDGVTGLIIDIRAGGNTDPTDLRSECVRKVIAVQIHRGDHIIILRADDGELQADICNGVFD